MDALIVDGAVLRQNGDPALLFEIVGVHYPLGNSLMGGEGAGLTEQLVDEGGLAVVNVGDNGDVSEGAGHSGLGFVAVRDNRLLYHACLRVLIEFSGDFYARHHRRQRLDPVGEPGRVAPRGGAHALRRAFGPAHLGRVGCQDVVFVARHGYGHTIPPHLVNYRANIHALETSGVTQIISVASVGGIRDDLGPGSLVAPHQIIDYTWGREMTFQSGGAGPVVHVDFTETL